MDTEALPILLVEDHPDDEFLTLHTLRKNGIENVVVVREAQAAIDRLLGKDKLEPVLVPRFILLDLRLPKMDGFEFLEAVRSHDATRDIPVVILSSSQQPCDLERCRNLGVTIFLNKPLDSEKLALALQSLNPPT